MLEQIRMVINDLPTSEKKVAAFILQNSKDVTIMTIHELAEKSNTSSSAVIRFCKKIGVGKFPNLKVQLSALENNNTLTGFFDIEPLENIQSIIDKTVSNTSQIIKDTSNILNEEYLKKAIMLIQQADAVYFYGIGASLLIAEDAAQKWARLGVETHVISDRHVLVMKLACVKNAVFFGISYSGETEDVVKMMKMAKKYKLKTISLTKIGDTKISRLADVSLYTARAPEAQLRSAATSSRVGQLFIIDVLFFAYTTCQYDKTIEYLQKTKQSIQYLKEI